MDLKAFLAGERPLDPRTRLRGHRRAAAGQAARSPRSRATRIAGGFEIVLACDMIVAADDAKFGLPEVKRGLVAAGGGAAAAAPARPVPPGDGVGPDRRARPGPTRATRWAWSTADHAAGGALDEALALAAAIAANGPLAVAATKRIVVEAPDWTADGAVRPAARDQRAGALVRGRPRGRHRLQGEARAALAGPLSGGRRRPAERPARGLGPEAPVHRTAAPGGGRPAQRLHATSAWASTSSTGTTPACSRYRCSRAWPQKWTRTSGWSPR